MPALARPKQSAGLMLALLLMKTTLVSSMKTILNSIQVSRLPLFAALITLGGTLIVPALVASDNTLTTSTAPAARPPIAAVQVSWRFGSDVFSTDNVRVGDLVDCILQFDQLPQLRYVIVKSGGFFGRSAQTRAVPADAIEMVNNRLRLTLTRAVFESLPVLPIDHDAFLSNPDNLGNLAKLSSTPPAHASLDGKYVTCTDLFENKRVEGKNNETLGIFTDLWVDFNANEAPFLEFAPTNYGLDGSRSVAYDVPTKAFKSIGKGAISFAVGVDDVSDSRIVENGTAYAVAAGKALESMQNKLH